MENQSIPQVETALFNEWRESLGKDSGFAEDGAADAARFLASPLKLLFVLKEINDPGGMGFDLREFMREGARGQTWNNIVRWTEGLHHLKSHGEKINWAEISHVNHDVRERVLPNIAAMNLKKQPGGAASFEDEILAATHASYHFIEKQLFLYGAEITICCGTYWYLKKAFFNRNDDRTSFKEKITKQGIKYAIFDGAHRSILIDFYHPAARIPSSFLLYALSDAVTEILGLN